MLLFVRRQYVEQIRSGLKTFEIRAGARYRQVGPGDELSINGQFRVKVLGRDVHDSLDSLLSAGLISAEEIRACYSDARGPFYVSTSPSE